MSMRQTFQGLCQGPNVDKKITASQSANRLMRKCILTLEQELTDMTNKIELVKGTLSSIKQKYLNTSHLETTLTPSAVIATIIDIRQISPVSYLNVSHTLVAALRTYIQNMLARHSKRRVS